MGKAESKMAEEFYDWLEDLPVVWSRKSFDENYLIYSFEVIDSVLMDERRKEDTGGREAEQDDDVTEVEDDDYP
mgnify:CR=1 FL=1